MAVSEESGTAGQAPQTPEPRHASSRARFLAGLGRSWLLFFFVGLLAFFWLTTPPGTFLTWSNLEQIALSTSEVILLAIGETFVIVTAGIDLSIGGILFFSAVCGGEAMLNLSGTSTQTINGHYPHDAVGIPVGIVVCILAGTLWGFVNGTLITKLRLPPFIVTLGTLGMTLGLGDLIDGGSYLPAPVPPGLSNGFGSHKIFGLYAPIYVAILVLAVAHVYFRYARFGRDTAAIGSNAEGTRRTGINVGRHIVKVYALAGFCAGLAAILDLAIYTNTTSVSHQTDNLNAIAAVVIGGTSLFGGVGTIIGSAIGAFIPTVLQNGLVIKNVSPFWQEVVVGATIILAVYLDQLRRRRGST
jgi:ribose transport system permease protein